eukprot:764953-Hanusia_phi.AAC.6
MVRRRSSKILCYSPSSSLHVAHFLSRCSLLLVQSSPPPPSLSCPLLQTVSYFCTFQCHEEYYFKLVALNDKGSYVSIFDGKTEYKVGNAMSQEVKAGHGGGFYVCESLLDLLKLGPLPTRSAMLDAPWAIVKLVGWGKKIKYNEHGKQTKVSITNIVPCSFYPMPPDMKGRMMSRLRRKYELAKVQREEGIHVGAKQPAYTAQETAEIFSDWQDIVNVFS